MGFWSRLFPSDKDRLAQARALLEQGRFDEARGTLVGVTGEEAERLYDEATRGLGGRQKRGPRQQKRTRAPREPSKPASLVVEPLAADGTQRIRSGEQLLEFNRPIGIPDKLFSNDPIEIATAVVDVFHHQALAVREFAFVDAVWMLAREGSPVRRCKAPDRQALVELVSAAAASDVERALAVLFSPVLRQPSGCIAVCVDAALGDRFAAELGRHLVAHGLAGMARLNLVTRLAESDPELCLRVLALEPDAVTQRALSFEALLAAMDAGQRSLALSSHWQAQATSGDETERLECALRLAAREDLSGAEKLWNQLADEVGDTALGTEAFLARLARVDPRRALGLSVREGHSGSDDLPRIVACHLGGADVSPVLDDYLESLTAISYRPYDHWSLLVELCLLLEDAERLRSVLERGGAAGWQIALAAGDPIRTLAARGSDQLARLLDITGASYPHGIVAGRDASLGGLMAGNVVFRPEWINFSRPRPVETLRVMVALAGEGPKWRIERLA